MLKLINIKKELYRFKPQSKLEEFILFGEPSLSENNINLVNFLLRERNKIDKPIPFLILFQNQMYLVDVQIFFNFFFFFF